MSTHHAELFWERRDQPFIDGRYSRRHELRFAATVCVVGSASPHVVPAEYCETDAVDPEAAFVGSLAGCHLLWFLSLAAAAGYRVNEYRDAAEGRLAPDAGGALAITEVTLRPHVVFDRAHAPDADTYRALQAQAHAACFIARSVRSALYLEPTFALAGSAQA